ncbi:MAG: hypothetical protein LQ344_005159 [Seirophora lacunosa]|nr:MAG: hypothetical protein LQ344_005159 [Seirophora lacunosa]
MSALSYNKFVRNIADLLGHEYVDELKEMSADLGFFTNRTAEEKEAVDNVRHFVRDNLTSQTDVLDIVATLDNLAFTERHADNMGRDIIAPGFSPDDVLRAINTAIYDEQRRHRQYRFDMRRFLRIVEPYLYEAFERIEDPYALEKDDDVVRAFECFTVLGLETDDLPDRDEGDELDDALTIGRIRAYWRWVVRHLPYLEK